MKNFIKTHKKQCIIGGSIFLALFLILIIWFFIVPIFSNNKYGDRLKDIEDHKISSGTIDDIKSTLKENKQVDEVSYHNEGRILNFIITVNGMTKDDAKTLGDTILDKISKDDREYYDIQLLIDSTEESNDYPIAAYKHKTEKGFEYGSEVKQSE